jgi:hypothetical protein
MKRRFFFHFNKPLSRQRKCVVWSVHFKGQCLFVNDIRCSVPCESHARKRQPFAVIRGMATSVTVTDGVAEIK